MSISDLTDLPKLRLPIPRGIGILRAMNVPPASIMNGHGLSAVAMWIVARHCGGCGVGFTSCTGANARAQTTNGDNTTMLNRLPENTGLNPSR